jgi:hypothetical protein
LKPNREIYLTSASAGYWGLFTDHFHKDTKYQQAAYSLHTTKTLENILKLGKFRNIKARYGFSELENHPPVRVYLGFASQNILSIFTERIKPIVISTARK